MDEDRKERLTFAVRLFAFLVFAAILPFAFLAWRFEMFGGGRSAIGWGVFGYVIIAIVCGYIMKQVADAVPWTMLGQTLNGFIKVIVPLLAVYFVLNSIRDSIEYLLQALVAVMACEAIAIPINPIPKWRHEQGIEEQERSFGRFFVGMKKWWKEKDG